ncbi:MAG: hypothetical protein JW940_35950 [Polyangiaceae bacterium]|nr:hypothetical protein [Polyangiaceae bacterium]
MSTSTPQRQPLGRAFFIPVENQPAPMLAASGDIRCETVLHARVASPLERTDEEGTAGAALYLDVSERLVLASLVNKGKVPRSRLVEGE